MRVLIFGAKGIVGQYMRDRCPQDVELGYPFRALFDLRGENHFEGDRIHTFLTERMPDVVINLAGENRVDVIEQADREARLNPDHYELYRKAEAYCEVNAHAPRAMAEWAAEHKKYYLHVSSQGVFDGLEPPYAPWSKPNPVNAYGRQKAMAEEYVKNVDGRWTIARLTFVLGVRLDQSARQNPLEQMLEAPEQRQVDDRFFSVAFARDAAEWLWKVALSPENFQRIVHIGTPVRTTRFRIARILQTFRILTAQAKSIEPVSHETFLPACAERPRDTTWDGDALHSTGFYDGLVICVREWERVRAWQLDPNVWS